MRQLIVPKRNRPIGKVKKGNEKLETTEELPNLGALYAPLTWAERLARVFNLMGPPSDCHLPPVWWHIKYESTAFVLIKNGHS
jgi:hypothetical protein